MKGFINRSKNAIMGFAAKAYKSTKKQASKFSVESSKQATIDIAESAVDSASSVIKGATELVAQPISDIKYISARNDEIKEMSNLVNFQAHGVNHHLSTYLSDEQLKSELMESKNTIEGIIKWKYSICFTFED